MVSQESQRTQDECIRELIDYLKIMATDLFSISVIKPKVRGFVCITTHPDGCAAHVKEQIEFIQSKSKIQGGPKKVLVIGCSTGYGLASRITAAFGCEADTLGVFSGRSYNNGRPASPGWYNTIALENEAQKLGFYAKSIKGDAFSNATKQEVIDTLKAELGPVDLVVYSLASARRIDPKTGEVYKSALKPVGKAFSGKTVDTDKKIVTEISLEPATDKEVMDTIKVMGGEDWKMWMHILGENELLAKGCISIAYSYIGPEITKPLYRDGTIGKAKEDLENTAEAIQKILTPLNGRAHVVISKAIVTQASSAIPVLSLYVALLFKFMKEQGTHEDCIQQIYRLFASKLYNHVELETDEANRIRIDDLEMQTDIQAKIQALWNTITTENVCELTDIQGCSNDFLKLFGFGMPNIDYEKGTTIERDFSN